LGSIYWTTAGRFEAQTDARLRLETDVLMSQYRDQAMPALLESVRQRNRDDGSQKIFFYKLLGPHRAEVPEALSELPVDPGTRRAYTTLKLGDVVHFGLDSRRNLDPVRVLVTYLPHGYRLIVGRDLHDQRELLDHILRVVLIAITLIVLLTLMGGALMGYGVLRRIDAVRETVGEIIQGDLSRRLPVDTRGDEFDQLSGRLNVMLERIELLMRGMREVSDNLAHDLRKPLTRLRNRLDVTLLEARSEIEYREIIEAAIADADSLIKTFNALLSIAQAEAGVRGRDWSAVNLEELAADMAELYGALAEQRGIEFGWSAEPGLKVHGNRQLLAQAVSNLLDNALKFTPQGSRVELTTGLLENRPAIIVTDTGPGIPAPDRNHALQRFVRLDGARSTEGNGLGLSLVTAVAKLHGADLRLEDNRPGLRVVICFEGPN
jgi:signal transduction histidine kinase